VEFSPHPLYRIEERDIHLELPVTPWEAALGATIKVPTPGGPVELKVPPESNSGRKLRLRGRGIPGKAPGDLYVVLQVAVPPATNEPAKALYKQMSEQFRSFNPRDRLGV
jgi:curved DNA-binding protein